MSLGLVMDKKPLLSQMKGMGNDMTHSFIRFGKMLGGALVAGLSVKALVNFSSQCLELGSNLAEVQNVVDVTFPGMSKRVDDFAQGAAASFGLSETMAKQFTGTYGAMSKAFGFTEQQAYDMSTTLTGLAGDVASFYNISQDAAYTKLKAVFSGETESLKDLGIVMTQTALDQYAMENGFGTTTSAMSEQEKVALRYRFVLDKLSLAQGDFARTSDSWANQTRLLRLQFDSLKASIGQGLIVILTPAIKGLNTLMGALVKAANTFKAFVFSLFGKKSEDMAAGTGAVVSDSLGGMADSARDAASGIDDVGDSTAKTAKEIRRSLAGFDQITKLTDNIASDTGGRSGGGGGKSGGGSGLDISSMLGDTASALKGEDYRGEVEEGFGKLFDFATNLKLTFENVFTDWKDLTGEAICEKVIAGLGGLLGAGVGFIIGGVPGAIVGSLLGVGLGVIFDSLIFNNDGKISRDEVGEMLRLALFGLTGGIIGFLVGGPGGALIGASIGMGLDLGIKAIDFFTDGKANGFLQNLTNVLGGFVGGVIGFVVGGPVGALLGATIGLGITFNLQSTVFGDTSGWTAGDWIKNIVAALAPFAGAAIGLVVGGPLGAAIGAAIGLGIHFLLKTDPAADGEETANGFFAGIQNVIDKGKEFYVTAKAKVKDFFTDSDGSVGLRGAWANVKAWFNGTYKNSDGSIQGLPQIWGNVKAWFNDTYKNSDGSISGIGHVWGNVKAWFSSTYKKRDGSIDGLKSPWANVLAWFNDYGSELRGSKKPVVDVDAKIVGMVGKYSITMQSKATGGVFVGGRWSNIPQFAAGGYIAGGRSSWWNHLNKYGGGTTNAHGTLFAAGEAGPEVVGHIGGRTEVLNRSQLASTMFSAVSSAMRYRERYTPRLAMIGASVSRSEQHLSTLAQRAAEASAGGMTDQAVELLRQILQWLQKMDFDVKLDGRSVKDQIVALINADTQATGVCEIVI